VDVLYVRQKMIRHIIISTFVLFSILRLHADPQKFQDGEWLRVLGNSNYEAISEDDIRNGKVAIGFPMFKKWDMLLCPDKKKWLLEGQIISSNTGSVMQGVHVYIQIGDSVPELLAISDADGRIKMRIISTISSIRIKDDAGVDFLGDKTIPWSNIYIGNPLRRGSETRIYNVATKK
jgi:hypothetical protein